MRVFLISLAVCANQTANEIRRYLSYTTIGYADIDFVYDIDSHTGYGR